MVEGRRAAGAPAPRENGERPSGAPSFPPASARDGRSLCPSYLQRYGLVVLFAQMVVGRRAAAAATSNMGPYAPLSCPARRFVRRSFV